MFIITAKLSKQKLILGAAALTAILLAVGVAGGLIGDVAAMRPSMENEQQTAQTETVEETKKETEKKTEKEASTLVLTNDARVEYLKACGWEVDADSCSIREVIIPEEFDETYQNYAALQSRQGFDMERLKGKRVKQITYTITNYPNDEDVIAELLVYRGNVVAGNICSMKTDGGFTRGLMDHPKENNSNQTDSTKNAGNSSGKS